MRQKLSHKLALSDILHICLLMQGKDNDSRKEELYRLTFDKDERVAVNALWVFTHFDSINNEWLYTKHDDLIDRVLIEPTATKRRLMLGLLLRQPFEEDSLRSDFIDFCVSKITACAQPYAIRALCIARLRANEVLSRTPCRTEDGTGHAGARSTVARLDVGEKTDNEENQ